jgi:aconitate decarboxylase
VRASESSHVGPYSQRVAGYVAGLRYEDLPDAVRSRIKLLVLDTLGCALYGADLPWSRILRTTLAGVDASGSAAVWGTGTRLSAPHAVLVNGAQIQGFELDDVHARGVMHVGAVVLPALAAVAELRAPMDGRRFLTAAVAGYEIGPRVGICMGPEHIGQGWHSGATVGVFSAVAGAASALGLSEERTVHALGIAGTQSSGLMAAQYGSMVKRMHAGRASQSGLYAALLADAGYTGIRNVFESEYGGFCTTFSRSHDRFDLEQLTRGLGEQFETMRISLKFYSCVASNHTTLDALRLLREAHPFGPEDVERITVHGSRVTVDHVGWPYEPEGVTAAQLNLPFCVAALLVEGEVFVDQFTETTIVDEALIALSRKVRVVEDPAITAQGASARHFVRVEVELRDGTNLQQSVEAARGSEQRFASEADVVRKFDLLTRDVIPKERSERLAAMVLQLERCEDVSEILDLLVVEGERTPRGYDA